MDVRYLRATNSVPGTDKIRFEDDGHKYYAYSQFYSDWVSSSNGVGAAPLLSATGVLSRHFHNDMDSVALRIWNNADARKRMLTDPKDRYYGCASVADIRAIWSQGATAGTQMHARFEDLANLYEQDRAASTSFCHKYLGETEDMRVELACFERFVNEFMVPRKLKFYRTELLLWHDVLHLSGTIDALLYDPGSDSYVIVDWKRCKNGVKGDPERARKPVSELSWKSRGMGSPAFEELRNHNLNKYGCQLTLYKHLIEHMAGFRISGLFLVVVDSAKLALGPARCTEIIEVPLHKYDRQISELFALRAESMLAEHGDHMDDKHLDLLLQY